MTINLPSKEEFMKTASAPRSRTILPEGDYIVRIVELQPNVLVQKYDSFQAKGRRPVEELPKEDIEEKNKLTLQFYSDRDLEAINDVEGNAVEVMSHFKFEDIATGMLFNRKTGEPHKMRQLLAYATGKNPNDDFSFDGEVTDLIGKFVGVRLTEGLTQKGEKKNTLAGFTKLPKDFAPDAAMVATGDEQLQRFKDARAKKAEGFDTSAPVMDTTVAGESMSDLPF